MISVAVVDASEPGNVGTIARSMKNFGLSELLLVDPPELDPEGEAYGFAGHAREDVLPNAREVSFDHLVENYHTVGCTAITNEDPTKHVRYPFRTPTELADSLRGVERDTAIVFGRERVGLENEELARLDEICSIPASDEYPVLNLGQAATVVLYELRELIVEETQHPDGVHERADEEAIEGLHDQFGEYLDAIHHPAENQHKAKRLWRRLLGRAHPTGREVSTLRGLFRKGRVRIEQLEAADDGDS
jgi:TrmH family RNA methyltransferase